MAVKVFTGSAEFKSLKREIDVVRSLPSHENIVMLFGDEEEVKALQQLLRMYYMCTYGTWWMVHVYQIDMLALLFLDLYG